MARTGRAARRYLAAALDEPFSLYEVLRAEPGASLDLLDLFRERTSHVSERSASKAARPHDVVFAHLVTVDGLTTLSGTASIVLEPAFKLEILDLAEQLRARHGAITSKVLFAEARPVRLTFLGLVQRRLNPHIPVLQNTDGEGLAPHRLRFILGHLALDGRDLVIEVNSTERARRLRREIEKAGRARVEALLEDFERRAGADPFAPPVARLRRELGLE